METQDDVSQERKERKEREQTEETVLRMLEECSNRLDRQ